MKMETLKNYITTENTSIVKCMQMIDAGEGGTIFVVDENGGLSGCVTDGDIRRYLIRTGDLKSTVGSCMSKAPHFITETDTKDPVTFMEENSIQAVPIVDKDKRIVDIVVYKGRKHPKAQKTKSLRNVPIIVMAGGKGTRLYPYTKILPKPLIPIGEVPILERVFDSFTHFGAKEFYLTVNYKKAMIKSYIEELSPDYTIRYVEEDKPLGTAGSIALIKEKLDKPVIVANCDSLINTDLGEIYSGHIESGNDITIVSSVKNISIPYGVIHSSRNGVVDEIEEKPELSFLINTGMYVVNPKVFVLIESDRIYHMTDLIDDAKESGYKVGMYPIGEDSFLDMGEFAEMKRMEEKLRG